MASNDNDRGGLLTAGGVLSIVAGVFELIAGGIMVALVSLGIPFSVWLFSLFPDVPGGWFEHSIGVVSIWLIVMGGLFLVLGILAIVGGVSAIRRKSFGLSLAGAICALPSNILGILAVIFVSLSKKEFEAEK